MDGYTDEYLYGPGELIKIGARRPWGGSVIFFGLADGATAAFLRAYRSALSARSTLPRPP